MSRRSRTDSQSTHRSCASRVEHVPSVIESPNATIAPDADADRTSIDFSNGIVVMVAENGSAPSTAAWSPPFGVATYEVVIAPECWLA